MAGQCYYSHIFVDFECVVIDSDESFPTLLRSIVDFNWVVFLKKIQYVSVRYV